jgi:hypothetical protein
LAGAGPLVAGWAAAGPPLAGCADAGPALPDWAGAGPVLAGRAGGGSAPAGRFGVVGRAGEGTVGRAGVVRRPAGVAASGVLPASAGSDNGPAAAGPPELDSFEPCALAPPAGPAS